MRLRSTVFIVATLLAPATLAVSLPAAPAAASDYVCTADGSCNGVARFEPDGEHFYIRDLEADGHSVVVRYVRHDVCSPITGRCQVNLAWHHYGASYGTYDHNMNIDEGVLVDWNVCLGEYGTETILWDTCANNVMEDA